MHDWSDSSVRQQWAMVQFRLGLLAPIHADLTPDNKKEASAMLMIKQ
jgi:hypothetical protein